MTSVVTDVAVFHMTARGELQLGLRELNDRSTGPHKSVFRLGFTEDDLDRLDAVLTQSAAGLAVH